MLTDPIQAFLEAGPFGVAGASSDRAKYGNKVLRCYAQRGLEAHPVHPSAETIEGRACSRDVASLPAEVGALSIITPPPVTERIVDAALAPRHPPPVDAARRRERRRRSPAPARPEPT